MKVKIGINKNEISTGKYSNNIELVTGKINNNNE